MKIFTSAQIRELDRYTIEHEPIQSIDLMERAASTLARTIANTWDSSVKVVVFAGPGNNGGDALAVARLLGEQGYQVAVFLFNISGRLSPDCLINKRRVQECKHIKKFVEVTQEFDPPQLEKGMLVIDGLFGSGLSKPLSGGFASLVKYINQSECRVVSIDIPSGLMTEDNSYNTRTNIIRADYTFTLQQMKLAFLFPENQRYLGRLGVLDIRLSAEGIEKADAKYEIVDESFVRTLLRPRGDFWHKGDAGTSLIVAGSYGMAGAAILASRACFRSGAGKVIAHVPARNNDIIQIAVPEAIVSRDADDNLFTEPVADDSFDAMGIGPGIGTDEVTATAFISQLRRAQVPTVVDADGLNILASHRAWFQRIPVGTILTPHPLEFERLAGVRFNDGFEQLSKAVEMAQTMQIYIILKGHYSALCMPDGKVMFNSTGNSGMATAGSGDVLTGVLTALLARGYNQKDACLIGTYVHGLAGDLAAEELGVESVTAGDIVRFLPKAFKRLDD